VGPIAIETENSGEQYEDEKDNNENTSHSVGDPIIGHISIVIYHLSFCSEAGGLQMTD